jgi:hypothetical protein
MEFHRAPAIFRDLQELGGRASRQLRQDVQIHYKMFKSIRTTSTRTGLVVTAYLDRNEYPTGLKPNAQLISSLSLKPGKILPRWNYTIAPNL